MNIALVAKRGSGKTTVSDALQQRGWKRLSWAEPVRQIAALAYDDRFTGSPEDYAAAKAATFEVTTIAKDGLPLTETITGTQVLQRIGTDAMRDNLDMNFWVKAALRRMEAEDQLGTMLAPQFSNRWVNDDTRFPNELEALRSRGFLIVGLYLPDSVRIARLIARDGLYDEAAESHASETSVSLDDCDVVVQTTQPVGDVIDQVLALSEQLA